MPDVGCHFGAIETLIGSQKRQGFGMLESSRRVGRADIHIGPQGEEIEQQEANQGHAQSCFA